MNDVAAAFVFQYGSNMSKARMQDPVDRIPEATPIKAAWTVDIYDFCFPVRSRLRNRAVSGIIPSEVGRQIFGAVYEIPMDLVDSSIGRPKRRTLDEIEDHCGNYTRTTIRIKLDGSDDEIEAITYLPNPRPNPGNTDEEYAGFILDGLAEWDAPPEYVAYVRGILEAALPKSEE